MARRNLRQEWLRKKYHTKLVQRSKTRRIPAQAPNSAKHCYKP